MDEDDPATEDWVVDCSDDELANEAKESGDMWEPTPSEIMTMYELLESKGVLEFEWQCPGRRSPSVNSTQSDLLEKGTASDEDNKAEAEPNEFDFDDEFAVDKPSPKISPRKRAQATSAQKRVARLDKVMFDIQRHRKLDELELKKDSPASASGSPRAKTPNDTKAS
ncbi:hypothetical protein JTE90_016605 [Oedothorax gibbosus]|uniref:PAXIP1-associated glutamate-rich protein 1 n=1 Tax=Oedothorax gibbosus TaxID=931172 RepID=A0AAV6U972_9ARAC|nr:hypothetical protein JTE90_016605 [Oedothorax gibbosus]